jgi:hypothetical protein
MADPATLMLAASTVLTVAGGVQQGMAASAQGKSQQQMYNQMALQQEAQGRAQAERADYVASQQESIAGSERASSQRIAMEKQREKRLVQSRAQAVAAASGGGALDPGVLDIMGGIEDQGNYNALVALYEGESSARNYESQANLTRWEGRQAQQASNMEAWGSRTQGRMSRAEGRNKAMSSYIGAAGSALSGGSSLYSKYGAASAADAGFGKNIVWDIPKPRPGSDGTFLHGRR